MMNDVNFRVSALRNGQGHRRLGQPWILCILLVSLAAPILGTQAAGPATSTSTPSQPAVSCAPTTPETSMYDPSLHLFVDDHHIRGTLAMKRVFGRLEKWTCHRSTQSLDLPPGS
jgi:hypothetical protein